MTNPATFGASDIASPGYVTKPQHHPYALGKVTKTFSPTLFGELLFSWARWYYVSFGLSNGFDPTKLGFPSSLAQNSLTLGFPSINPGEMSSLGNYYNEHDVSDRYEGKLNFTKLLGNHTLKFGGTYGLGKYSTRVYDNSTGSYSSTAAFTQGPNPLVSSTSAGFGFASFLLGTLSSGTQNVTDINGHYQRSLLRRVHSRRLQDRASLHGESWPTLGGSSLPASRLKTVSRTLTTVIRRRFLTAQRLGRFAVSRHQWRVSRQLESELEGFCAPCRLRLQSESLYCNAGRLRNLLRQQLG